MRSAKTQNQRNAAQDKWIKRYDGVFEEFREISEMKKP